MTEVNSEQDKGFFERETGAAAATASAGVTACSAVKEPPVKDKKAPSPKKTRMFKIIIDEQDNSDKNINQLVNDGTGRQFYLPRGVECVVPEGVVNVLKESKYELGEFDSNGDLKTRMTPRFQFRVLEEIKT